MVSRRQERIAEMLMEELSILISSELSDPRLDDALVSVTDVQLSPDLQNARVYVQHQADPKATRGILEALRHSHTFLRRQLAENLQLRMVPELHFMLDETEKRAQHVDALLDSLKQDTDTKPQEKADGSGDEQPAS